ncbi:MAG: exodeoxyribonuclease III [Sporocytophaga sp.]|uniref:exodeoxyribonuclease III n=1 Tax=Sporocytophaga sp. TaxID=2231183 RepID=UPI001B2BD9EA|nr:exodeoxyribonuclease III [Sporocytophaga sp.]MBO9698599.1 exodeoxyribonuclease III [Sporocytophaga sp.]
MKILTYNVNGLRSAISKGFVKWLSATGADVICLQEIKSTPEQVETTEIEELGFKYLSWHPAVKKGYSGVAIFSKIKPVNVCVGCGMEKYDYEGRVLRIDFETFSILNVYMPSGSSGEERQAFKMCWLDDFYNYVSTLRTDFPRLIVCGDYNICHKAIDIHNPKSNVNSSGFLPEERAWMTKFFESGFVDAFRHFNSEPHHYTWWTYRMNARSKNLGWRIDYHAVTENLKERLKRAIILNEAKHSDHCPVLIEIV